MLADFPTALLHGDAQEQSSSRSSCCCCWLRSSKPKCARSLARDLAMHAASSSEGGWSSDEGGPPVDPVDPSELPERSTLTFGQGLLEQGFAGESKPMKATLQPRESAPKSPARPPPGPASDRAKPTVYKSRDFEVLASCFSSIISAQELLSVPSVSSAPDHKIMIAPPRAT